MYAVIRAGGRQVRVRVGDVVQVDRLDGEIGAPVVFDRVLAVGGGTGEPRIGRPVLDGAAVRGSIVGQDRAKKIVTYVYKKTQNANRRQRGHRQDYTAVKIDAIEA